MIYLHFKKIYFRNSYTFGSSLKHFIRKLWALPFFPDFIWARATLRSNLLSAKKNNITLTAFDLFDFVLLITVYLITYRFSWQTDASYQLANISTFTYQEHTKQCLAILTDIIFESHFIDLHCSAKIIWHINSWFNYFEPYYQI